MDWEQTVIWWHCYPLRFVGAETEAIDHVEHRLPHLAGWLDYVLTIGANGVLLAPIFASKTHGYDTLDHFQIDHRLGDEDDFRSFVQAARSRGIRVVLDGVFNHVSRDHRIAREAIAGGRDSEAGRWIRWVGEYPRVFEGVEALVELDLGHPPVQDYVGDIMTHWLARGIDGWRLDAAYAAGPDAYRPILERVKAEYPESWTVAEVIHGDYADFVDRSGVDSITQYEIWKAIWSSLNDRNFHELAWNLQRGAGLHRPLIFIGNHDVTRIATQLTDPRNLGIATALLLLLPGIPAIYAGDEQGFTGMKTDGRYGDDAVRPPFPANPDELSPLGAPILAEYQRLIHLRRSDPWLTDAHVTAIEVANDHLTLELRGPDSVRHLLLNVSDEPVWLPAGDEHAEVGPHSWVWR